MNILNELKERGCLQDATHQEELAKLLSEESVTFYCGFDPTNTSLQIGNVIPLILMRRLQKAGHKPIVVLGTGTGIIGDPSGKSEERKLLSNEEVLRNVERIESQIKIFLDDTGPNKFTIVRNDTWLKEIHYLDFLRDIGKYFSVNMMIAKDSVRARLENREQGISYTEFSYMILQGYDYYHLNQKYNCRIQVGGSDQWGNITAGTELIRRKLGESHPNCYAMTFPLLTDSEGRKFGKTEKSVLWIDPEKTSPYKFYQFWLQTMDADVIKFLKIFTELSLEEITSLEVELKNRPELRSAQKKLAEEITLLVHGKTETQKAQQATNVLFGGDISDINAATVLEIFNEVPSSELSREVLNSTLPLTEVLVNSKLVSSKSEARRLIENGGAYVNNQKVSNVNQLVDSNYLIDGSLILLRSGKKSYHLLKVV